jgi:hypothetical protein
MVDSRGKAPKYQAVASLAPPTGVASPLAGIVFHVPDPCASCWNIDSGGGIVQSHSLPFVLRTRALAMLS